MILAVSRFRVANGTEAAVERAFQDRPHLVEEVPGFLGMEVFTAAADRAVFYLVTRWTDEVSFRTWHGSEAHRLSHRLIPRGLKLDASQTQLLVLDRLEPAGAEEEGMDLALPVARLLETSGSLYYVRVAADGTIRACNRTASTRLSGGASCVGKPVWPCLTEPDATRLRAILAAGARRPPRVLLNFLDAAEMPYTLDCLVDVQGDGAVILGEESAEQSWAMERLVELTNDLSLLSRERQLAAERERAARVEAETAVRLRDLFFAMLSHELRTPLASIVGWAEILRRQDDGRLGKGLEIVAQNAETLTRLVDDLLDYARVSSGDALRRELIDVRTIVREAVDRVRVLAGDRDETIEVLTGDTPLPVHGDRDRLGQVVVNLLTNALKFSPAGAAITARARHHDTTVVVEVVDRGVGLAADELAGLFTPFHQGEGGRSARKGLGLGLAIVKRLVELHGGRVSAASTGRGHGATFTVELPLHA